MLNISSILYTFYHLIQSNYVNYIQKYCISYIIMEYVQYMIDNIHFSIVGS